MGILRTAIGGFPLVNPVICGVGEAVTTESGIRAALAAGAAGVVAKSVNENPTGGRQLDWADYVWLDTRAVDAGPTGRRGLAGTPDGRAVAGTASGRDAADTGQAVSLFNRSGLMQRPVADWIAAIDRQVRAEGRFVAASIVYAGADGAVSIARAARQAGLRVFELNVGAPHAAEAEPGAIVQWRCAGHGRWRCCRW